MSSSSSKKSKKDQNDGFKKSSGVNFNVVSDSIVVDKRYQREMSKEVSAPVAVSSTFDAFQRMAAGLEGRTIADKLNDPNRPTWEQYKKDNEALLDNVGGDARKMVEYRAELDREREQRMSGNASTGKRSGAIPDSSDEDNDESSSDSDSDSNKKRKKSKKEKKSKDKKKKTKKDKKEKKVKKKRSRDNSDNENKES
jgi:hypothetical protein